METLPIDPPVTWIDDLPIPSIGAQLHNGTMKMRGRHGGLCKGVVCDGLERYFWCWWTTTPYQDVESECEWGQVKSGVLFHEEACLFPCLHMFQDLGIDKLDFYF